jgi:hypothetical protein
MTELPEQNCASCNMPPTTLHRSSCPVELRLKQMEKTLRLMPNPELFGRTDLPFEEVPDGPMLTSGMTMGLDESIVCAGATIKSTVIDVPGLGWRPAMIYSFSKVQGGYLRPILFITENDEDFAAMKTLTYQSINTSTRIAREWRENGKPAGE